MNGTTHQIPRSAAVVLIGAASLVAVIAIVLVTLLLKPLASQASGQQDMNMAPGVVLSALDSRNESQSSDPESQGKLPNKTTAFGDHFPGIVNLDPDLLHALREASTAANAEGVDVFVNSGWRSKEYQVQLYREAAAKYGSEEEASRWVATPEVSSHVSGRAVDLGGVDATAWFSQFGASYGLCQTYENEPWHYELRPEAATEGCPAMSTDATMH